MEMPLDAGQVEALRQELGSIQAYLSVVPPAQAAHPSVARARERATAIQGALKASAERQAKLTKKMRKTIPVLIDQVAAVDPVTAGHMKALLKGDVTARDALMQFAAANAGKLSPQFASLMPLLGMMFSDEE